MRLRSVITCQGALKEENRDVTGTALNNSLSMFIIADGTAKPRSGELAFALVEFLAPAFENLDIPKKHSISDVQRMISVLLDQAHVTICPDYPLASVSYLVLVTDGINAITIHAGDCCLGIIDGDNQPSWITPPHCLANWKGNASHQEIASSACRKKLTRCMSYRRQHYPDIQIMDVAQGANWILATDGFWADLTDDIQRIAITEMKLNIAAHEDDITFMLLMAQDQL